jgi:hypothetical protein
MALSDKKLLTVLAGVGGAVALYYLLRYHKKDTVSESAGKDESETSVHTQSNRVSRIIKLQAQLGLQTRADPSLIEELSSLLGEVSAQEMDEVKANGEYASFLISDWFFCHTLRTRKEVHWDNITGLIDEGLSPQERELGRRVAETMRKAYWDKHLEDLDKPVPDFKHIIERLSELKARINGFFKSQEAEVFDVDLIKQTIDSKAFDRSFFVSLVKNVVNIMGELESPAAHEQTTKWVEQELVQKPTVLSKEDFHAEIIGTLKFLFGQLDLLDSEMANYRSSQMAIDKKRKKERDVFHKIIAERIIEIPNLRIVLKPIAWNPSITYAAVNKAIVLACKNCIVEFLEGKGSNLPESLHPDQAYILEIGKKIRSNIRLASVLVAIHSQLQTFGDGKKFASQSAEELTKFGEKISSLVLEDDASTDEIVDEVSALIIQFSGKPLEETIINNFRKGVEQCCAATSPVYQLYVKRSALLMEKGMDEATPLLASNAFGSSPHYLSLCAKHLSNVIAELIQFLAEHLHVYLPIYRDIVSDNL